MIIGIISYLPNDVELRSKRLDKHQRQLELFKTLNVPIYIVAQNYKQEELSKIPGINYYCIDRGIGPANARNVMLQTFYNSNEDFMMLCDDDMVFYDYYNIRDFFEELKTNPNKFLNDLDYIRGIMASQVPFKESVYAQRLNLTHYVFEDKNTIGTTALAILKNFKKYYNKEIYYTDLDVSEGNGYEDKDFCCQLKLNGIKTHVLDTFILKAYNYEDNSTLFNNYEDRLSVHNQNNSKIYDKYNDLFENNVLKKSYKSNKLTIKRDKPITIPDNLKPQGLEPKVTIFDIIGGA